MEEQQLYRLQQIKRGTMESMLQPGEQLLWHGAPGRGLRLRKGDLSSSFFGLFVLAFAIFWCVLASRAGGFFWMFGLLFVFIGLNQTVVRYFVDAHQRKETYYGITTQKIILMQPKEIHTLFYDQLPCLELELDKDGGGTIYLSPERIPTTDKHGRATTTRDPNRKGLYHIQNVTAVYGIIQQQMTRSSTPQS